MEDLCLKILQNGLFDHEVGNVDPLGSESLHNLSGYWEIPLVEAVVGIFGDLSNKKFLDLNIHLGVYREHYCKNSRVCREGRSYSLRVWERRVMVARGAGGSGGSKIVSGKFSLIWGTNEVA